MLLSTSGQERRSKSNLIRPHPYHPFSAVTGRSARRQRRGFTLAEVMIVVVVSMMILSWAMPNYFQAVEQSRIDLVGANLLMIWTAQRMYFVNNATYASSTAALVTAGLLDSSFESGTTADGKYEYTIDSASASAFKATAERKSGERWAGNLSIDQGGNLTGSISTGEDPNVIMLTPSLYAIGL